MREALLTETKKPGRPSRKVIEPQEPSTALVAVPKSKHTTLDIYTPLFQRKYPDGIKFDADRMYRFLEAYMATGRVGFACEAASVSAMTVRTVRKEDPLFADAYDHAETVFRDTIEDELFKRAMIGEEEPIIGGRNRDEVVAVVRRKSDRLLERIMNKHLPEYRDNKQLDVNVSGGVLVVGATMTEEEFEKEAAATHMPKEALATMGAIEAEYEDVT